MAAWCAWHVPGRSWQELATLSQLSTCGSRWSPAGCEPTVQLQGQTPHKGRLPSTLGKSHRTATVTAQTAVDGRAQGSC